MSESTTELAVHLAAAAQGADAARLCDSASFMNRVAGMGPDTPGFVKRVADAVREAVETNKEYRLGGEQPVLQAEGHDGGTQAPGAPLSRNEQLLQRASRRAALTPNYDGEITVQDVQDADPRVVADWATAGKLAHLGIPAQKRRGRR
ncbi:hypothetical protein [Streptomyces sp. RPT161]|uniref:hypothetical protein n=1 Tax=Streptomyces sp. RPT161 TaxID=3015993 RepID=UPI0022B911B9|nr:hypothetical protein [Streptomyces sp. RPT161]